MDLGLAIVVGLLDGNPLELNPLISCIHRDNENYRYQRNGRWHRLLRQYGDVATLQAGVARLAKLWANSTLNVLTEWPELLVRFCTEAIPLQAAGRNYWIGDDLLLGRFARFTPERVRLFLLSREGPWHCDFQQP